MKRLIRSILTAILILCFAAVSWGTTLEGVTLTGVSVTNNPQFKFTITTLGEDDSFTLPIYSGGSYNFNVEWGDDSADIITAYNDAAVTHTYEDSGVSTYAVTITGTIQGWRFDNGGDTLLMKDISSWGPLRLGNNGDYFSGCSNLTVSATDVLDLTGITNLAYMFYACTSLTTIDVSLWDIGSVTNLNGTFYSCSALTTLDVSSWDVGLVTNLGGMFYSCTSLISLDVSLWDTGSVTDLNSAFRTLASLVVAPTISSWNIASLATASLFLDATIALSTAAYDAVLIAWGAQEVQDNVTIHFGAATYTGGGDAAAAKAHLEAATPGGHNWTITDGGIAP